MLIEGGYRKCVVASSYTITAGSSTTHTMLSSEPATIGVTPGGSGSMNVFYQITSGGGWRAWPSGSVTAATYTTLASPVYAIRFTATTADGVGEVAQ